MKLLFSQPETRVQEESLSEGYQLGDLERNVSYGRHLFKRFLQDVLHVVKFHHKFMELCISVVCTESCLAQAETLANRTDSLDHRS